jgi:hypothetical protein
VQLRWSLNDEPVTEKDDEESRDPEYRKGVKCTIFLGYTSNMISSGVREIIRYLCQHKLVDVIVSSAGGIEEDFIKCFAPTYCVGDFSLDGCALRLKGQNRIGACHTHGHPAQPLFALQACLFPYRYVIDMSSLYVPPPPPPCIYTPRLSVCVVECRQPGHPQRELRQVRGVDSAHPRRHGARTEGEGALPSPRLV